VTLSAAEAHYVVHVLRLHVDDVVTAFDGIGHEWHIQLTEISHATVRGQVIAALTLPTAAPKLVVLGQALPKHTKMDLIVEKCTELGVTTLVPLHTERTVVREVPGRIQIKLARWRRVAVAAARQCGRGMLLDLPPPQSLTDFCAQYGSAPVKIVCWEGEQHRSLRQVLALHADQSPVVVLIGPEGGLTEHEITMAQAHGFLPTSLGPHILRTETAAIAIASIIRYSLGELEPYGQRK
jgi:16S rRNA (uracil1498-N3)-methyltransferase